MIRALTGFLAGYALCIVPLAGLEGGEAPFLAGAAFLVSLASFLVLIAAILDRPMTEGPVAVIMVTCLGAVIGIRAGLPPNLFTDLIFDLAHVGVAASLGRLLANRVEHLWWLVPLGLTGALADLLSVFLPQGLTHKLLEEKSPALDYVLVVWPTFRVTGATPYMGVADLVFAAIFYGIGARFELPRARLLGSLWAGMAGAIAIVGLTGFALPVTPFMIVTVVAFHNRELWRSLKAERTVGES